MAIVDFEAAKKWAKLPKDIQERLLRNVYCSSCGTTVIVNYSIKNDSAGIVLEGNCKKCGKNVARLIEND